MEGSTRARRLQTFLREQRVAIALFVASILYCFPPLWNAAGTNSDAAIVGLQAMHLLHGEWSWFLWGSGYQTAADAVMAAPYFVVLGPTPFALMLSALLGHVALTFFVYATLRRRFSRLASGLLAALVVFVPGSVHTYVLYPPRQCSLTLFFAGIWLLDGAPGSRRPVLRLAGGAAVAALSTFADPFALLFLPALAVFVVLTAHELERDARLKLGAAGLGGLVIGVIPFTILTHSAGATHGTFVLDAALLTRNWKLFVEQCFPFILSLKVYFCPLGRDYIVWQAPGWFRPVQIVGAIVLISGTLAGGAAFFLRRLPWSVRRLGAFGASMLPMTIGAFLVSSMAMDFFSARYLVPIILFAPFACSPLVELLKLERLAPVLLPYFVSAAVCGWLHYGSDVDGFRIRHENGPARDEHELADVLRARGIHYGFADYWVSYRLTFLFREDPTIVPNHDHQQRYRPYDSEFRKSTVVAYIFDPLRSREDLSGHVAAIREGRTSFERSYQELHAGRYTVLILRRSGVSANARAVRRQGGARKQDRQRAS